MKTWVKVLLVVLVLTLVGVISFFVYMGMQNKGPVEPVEDQNITDEGPVSDNNNDWQQPVNNNNVIDSSALMPNDITLTGDEAELLNKAKVEQLSSSFIEVFGSYSTDSHYQNLFDLKEMVTSSYWGQLERYISAEESTDAYSVWTKALKANVSNLSDNSAQVLLKTQRGEREDKQSAEKVFYQDAEVFLLQEGGIWLVNKVNWIE